MSSEAPLSIGREIGPDLEDDEPHEWRKVAPLKEETCQNCGTTIVDGVKEPCPECGMFRCPHLPLPGAEPCGETFDTKRGVSIHHQRVHDYPLKRYRDCPECGEVFSPNRDDQTFCSSECVADAKRDQKTVECGYCGQVFQTERGRDQDYCSRGCANKGRSTRLTRECGYCGDEFETIPSQDYEFCSRACGNKARANPTTLECEFCGDEFQTTSNQQFCSPVFADEAEAVRPDNLADRLHELFVEENLSVAETARRIPDLSEELIRKRLQEYGWYQTRLSYAEQLRSSEADSLEDLSREKATRTRRLSD